MARSPRNRLTEDERRALQLLACRPRGVSLDALVLGHGLKLQSLTDLVRAELAKRYHVTVTGGGRTTGVAVAYMKITADGRKAIKE